MAGLPYLTRYVRALGIDAGSANDVWELFPNCRRCGGLITEADVMRLDPENPFRVMHYGCPIVRLSPAGTLPQ